MGCIHGVDNDGKTPVEQHVCDICGNSYGHKWRYFLSKHSYLGYSYARGGEGEGGRGASAPSASFRVAEKMECYATHSWPWRAVRYCRKLWLPLPSSLSLSFFCLFELNDFLPAQAKRGMAIRSFLQKGQQDRFTTCFKTCGTNSWIRGCGKSLSP